MNETLAHFTVRDAIPGDLDEIARIHAESFADRALIRLGREAVRRYYAFLLEGFPLAKPICAVNDEGALAGFCFAGVYGGSFRGYIRKNLPFLIGRVLLRPWLIFSPLFRDLTQPVIKVLRWMLRSHKRKPAESVAHQPVDNAMLIKQYWGVLAVAVDPAFQRQGIGDLLMISVEEHARSIGVENLNLSVHPNNMPAVSFYEKLGWEKVQSSTAWDGKMIKRLN